MRLHRYRPLFLCPENMSLIKLWYNKSVAYELEVFYEYKRTHIRHI